MSTQKSREAMRNAIAKFTTMHYVGWYGIRFTYDIHGMIKAGLLDEQLKGARMLADHLKRKRGDK